MIITTTIAQVQTQLTLARRKNKTIGFVPTMGALHEGHLSLLRRSKEENALSVLSIFVNPTQFGPSEDFTKYPREKKKDVLLAKKENIDIIFYPSEKLMYPPGYLTSVEVKNLSDVLCGRSRPGHFSGVATVVTKLLNIIQPNTMYLGQKDAQQCVILKRLVQDLNFKTKVIFCPTVREPDGLAMSSRNKYLSTAERKEAPVLYRSLCLARDEIKRGLRNATRVRYLIEQNIRTASHSKIDYVVSVNSENLMTVNEIKGSVLLMVAARWGQTRLIDNIRITLK